MWPGQTAARTYQVQKLRARRSVRQNARKRNFIQKKLRKYAPPMKRFTFVSIELFVLAWEGSASIYSELMRLHLFSTKQPGGALRVFDLIRNPNHIQKC